MTTLIGRTTELATLERLLEVSRRGDRAVALVGGEAGIGKTRLVTELADRARAQGAMVLVGGCLDIDEGGIPYAPVVEALGSLSEQFADDESAHLGLAVRRVLERVGTEQPVMLLVEDVHWADRSTRDLIAYLATAGPELPLTLVITYRSEDLLAGHPLRRFRADLERRPHVVHLRLERFHRAEATALLTAILGGPPEPNLADAIFRRSEGNPFFLEELAVAATAGTGQELPPLLRDVLMSRVEQLSDTTQLVLRVAAVGGRRVDHDRLAAVAPLDATALTEALREAHAANVITVDPHRRRYEFRHALLHEAVYADVLPGERSLYHERYAESGVAEWAELAHHWRAAGRVEEALVAMVEAGLAAEDGYAPAEAHQYYEVALELWAGLESVPDGVRLGYLDLLTHAGDAASRTGAFERAVELTSVALANVDEVADPTAAGLLHERRAWFQWRAGDEEQALEEYEAAVRLVPATPPSTARARVLAAYADALERSGRHADARLTAEEAIAIATAVGTDAAFDEGHARHMLGLALAATGDLEPGIAELHHARVLAERNGDVADVAGTYVHLWRVLAEHRRADEMVQLAADAASFCRAAEMEVASLLLDCLGAAFLHQLGRWDEADALMARDDNQVWGLPATVWNLVQGLLAVDRGALPAAREHLETARYLAAQVYDGRINGLLYRALAELALWEHRAGDALATVTTGLTLTGDDEMLARLAALGLRAAADEAEAHRAAGDSPSAEISRDAARCVAVLERLDERARARHAPPSSEVRASVAMGDAELTRLDGKSDPERWAEVVARWDEIGFPAPAAYARWRLAAAVLGSGRRGDAVPLWRDAHAAAARLGANGLRAAIEADTARAAIRIAAESTPEDAPAPYGLTARELEVLTLVAAGQTNRQIGEALFISEKTASVHVSHILAKLGAATRAQAAALASQTGLVGHR